MKPMINSKIPRLLQSDNDETKTSYTTILRRTFSRDEATLKITETRNKYENEKYSSDSHRIPLEIFIFDAK